MKARNVVNNRVIEVISARKYAVDILSEAVYQMTSNYNNHVILFVPATDMDDSTYEINGMLYTTIYTNTIEFFNENYSKEYHNEAIIEEQLTLF